MPARPQLSQIIVSLILIPYCVNRRAHAEGPGAGGCYLSIGSQIGVAREARH